MKKVSNKGSSKRGKVLDPKTLPVAAEVLPKTLADFGDDSMRIYGQKTNEDRSIPDYYDGCKPVQRRILQSFIDQSARSKSPYVKTARIVGHCLGAYHPHGDSSVAGAIETMVNSPTQLVDGKGNWGDPIHGDDAAAMRYTNARLSRYSELVFFDSRMLAVAQSIPNYDDKGRELYVLPARLPNAIINGNSGIGVGIVTDTPSFTPQSALNVLKKALSSWDINTHSSSLTPADVATLQFHYPQFGAKFDKDANKSEFRSLIKRGEGGIEFGPFGADPLAALDKNSGSVVVNSFGPGINLDRALDKVRESDWFVRLEDETGIENGTRPQYRIFVKKQTSWASILQDIQAIFSTQRRFKVNLTVRQSRIKDGKLEERITMRRYALVDFFNDWLKRRIVLESKALTQELHDNAREARLTEVRILASAKLDFIFRVLKSGKAFDGMRDMMVRGLKIKPDEAEYVLRMQAYRLSKLEGDEERKKLKELKAKEATLRKLLAKPHKAVLLDLEKLEAEKPWN